MKLALHRSIVFWAGILVMSFIAWAWRDSLKYDSSCYAGSMLASHENGGFEIKWYSEGVAHHPVGFGREPVSLGARITIPTFPRAVFLRGEGRSHEEMFANIAEWQEVGSPLDSLKLNMKYSPREDWVLFLPHWLILPVVFVCWICLLVWRAWRRKKKCQVIGDQRSVERQLR